MSVCVIIDWLRKNYTFIDLRIQIRDSRRNAEEDKKKVILKKKSDIRLINESKIRYYRLSWHEIILFFKLTENEDIIREWVNTDKWSYKYYNEDYNAIISQSQDHCSERSKVEDIIFRVLQFFLNIRELDIIFISE